MIVSEMWLYLSIKRRVSTIKQKIKEWLRIGLNYKHKRAWIDLWQNKIKPFMTLKMMLVFGTVWLVSTGWSWVFIVLGPILDIGWMSKVGLGAQVFFWNPFFSEKLITIPFSIWLYTKIFGHSPNIEVSIDERS